MSEDSQLDTKVVCSTSKEEVLENCGSRYTISSPLISINTYLNSKKKYAFIGKPCDVIALRNLARIDERVEERFPYMISFMCAGMPSKNAGKLLLERLGTTEEKCNYLSYRGNGWPGYTSAIDQNGKEKKITYEESWGSILGRNVSKSCRLCMDGIGEAADISCGDGWYNIDSKPDFSEHTGRNIVFPRTERGRDLLDSMIKEQYIEKEESNDIYVEMKNIQNYQFVRRTTMKQKIAALRFFRRPIPKYSEDMMKEFGKNVSIKLKIKIFVGTCNRIIKHKL